MYPQNMATLSLIVCLLVAVSSFVFIANRIRCKLKFGTRKSIDLPSPSSDGDLNKVEAMAIVIKRVRQLTTQEIIHNLHKIGISTKLASDRSDLEMLLATSIVVHQHPSHEDEQRTKRQIALLVDREVKLLKNTPTNVLLAELQRIRKTIPVPFSRQQLEVLLAKQIVKARRDSEQQSRTISVSNLSPSATICTESLANGSQDNSALQCCIVELQGLTSFDSIVQWGERKGKEVVSSALAGRGVQANNATQSITTLSALLADSVLTERQRALVATNSAQPLPLTDIKHKVPTSTSWTCPPPPNTKALGSGTRDGSIMVNQMMSEQNERVFDQLFVEKGLLSTASKNALSMLTDGLLILQDSLLSAASRLLSITLHPLRFQSFPVLRTTAGRACYGILYAVLDLCVGVLHKVAYWAGGKLCPPSHVLFIAGTYAVLKRTGVKGWVVALGSIKLIAAVIGKPSSENDGRSSSVLAM